MRETEGPTLRVSLLTSAATHEAHTVEMSASELLDTLAPHQGFTCDADAQAEGVTCHVRARKDGPCWSPVTWSPDPEPDEETGWEGPVRLARNALGVSCLVYDLDWDETPEKYAPLQARLTALGWRYGIHETFTAGRSRLVVPLTRAVEPSHYAATWEAGRVALGDLDADPTGRDLARVSYLPACPPGGERACEQGGSVWLDPARLGGGRTAAPVEKSKPATQTFPENFEPPEPLTLNVEAIRTQVSRISGDLRAPLLALVDFRLHLKKGSRENELHRLASAFTSFVAEARGPRGWETTEAFFRPAVERMEEVSDKGVGYYVERVHSSWARACEYAERVDAHKAVSRSMMEKLRAGGLTGGGAEADAEPDLIDGQPWQDSLIYNLNPDGSLRNVRNVSSNIDLILTHDPAFKGRIRYNELYRRMEVSGGALAGHDGSYDVALMQWLERSTFRIEARKEMCGSTLLHHSRKFPYNPVSEYLTSRKWDGTKRIHRVFLDYCGAIGNDAYLQSISRKFFISAAARALEPGCKVDTVPVLQGRQGAKKTSFVECIAKGWYTTSTGKVEDKDMRVQTTESWLVELSELASMRKSSIESLRGFITQRNDRIRIPYATYHEEFPRRCVFIGTTNAAQPLTDEEGNRRWWVVTCDVIDLKALERDRDQLWAEAVWCYRQHVQEREAGVPEEQMQFRWWLTPEEQRISDEENEMFTVENTVLLDLQMWQRARYEANEMTPPMTLTDIARKVLRVSTENLHRDTSLLPRLSKALQVLGWRRIVRQRNGGRFYVYQMQSKEEFEQTVRGA